MTQPYQPLLLRLLHGLTALLLVAAILTAFWTYNVYDGRWGTIPLPSYGDIEGIHGTFGLLTLLIFPAFVFYAFHRGHRRLIQPNSWAQLTQIGQPLGWYACNRLINTLALVALTFALFSGKMMDDTWLPKGELDHAWYYAHLISWVIMVGTIALHLLINAKVGGAPLLLSMFSWKFRDQDHPMGWPAQVQQWWLGLRQSTEPIQFPALGTLRFLEWVILISLLAAWIIPLLK